LLHRAARACGDAGHSTKSIARELGIAPGTVMVHKRNLFSKLGITSQYELFSRFIDAL
jgi:DNA-binding NarL/FixJ family response regulator